MTEFDAGLGARALADELAGVLAGPEATRELALLRAAPAGTAPDPRPIYRLLGASGLFAANWPTEYGGRGATPVQAAEVVEALIHAGVPETLYTLSVQIVGSFLLTAGTPTQRAAHLPALASGERYATVLYSEPDSGSDLASLQTTGRPSADGGWEVTGRKVFSVYSELADLALCAARTGTTGARYSQLTLFLLPLDAPGVHIGQLDSMADEAFCDVVLDRVRVGPDAVIGPVDGAWALITDALALERTGIDYQAKARRWLDRAVAHAVRGSGAAGAGAGSDGAIDGLADGDLAAIGKLDAEVRAGSLLSRDALAQLTAGGLDPAVAAVAKWHTSETAKRVAWWAAETVGLPATLSRGEPAGDGVLEAAYREVPGLTISAGTSEMMLQTIAGSPLVSGDNS